MHPVFAVKIFKVNIRERFMAAARLLDNGDRIVRDSPLSVPHLPNVRDLDVDLFLPALLGALRDRGYPISDDEHLERALTALASLFAYGCVQDDDKSASLVDECLIRNLFTRIDIVDPEETALKLLAWMERVAELENMKNSLFAQEQRGIALYWLHYTRFMAMVHGQQSAPRFIVRIVDSLPSTPRVERLIFLAALSGHCRIFVDLQERNYITRTRRQTSRGLKVYSKSAQILVAGEFFAHVRNKLHCTERHDWDDPAILGCLRLMFLEACRVGHVNVLRLLVHEGVDPTMARQGNRCGIRLAAKAGRKDTLEYLLSIDSESQRRLPVARDAISCAAIAGHVEIAQLLLDHGFSVNARIRHQYYPLVNAALHGHAHFVDWLFAHGVNLVNNQDGLREETGSRALAIAAGKGYVDVVEVLLRNGVSPNPTQDWRFCPLHMAKARGRAKCEKILLQAGATPIESTPTKSPFCNFWRRKAFSQGAPWDKFAHGMNDG
jgi:ankyrin repeat protein